MDRDLVAEPGQPPDDVDHLGVAQIGDVRLEGEAEHQHLPVRLSRRLWIVSAIQPPMPSLIARPARITRGRWPRLCAQWLR